MNRGKIKPNGEYQVFKETRLDSRRRQDYPLTRSSEPPNEKVHIFRRNVHSTDPIATDPYYPGQINEHAQSGSEWSRPGFGRRWTNHQSPDTSACSKERKGERGADSNTLVYSKTKYTVKKRDEAAPGADASNSQQQQQRPQRPRGKEESPGPQQQQQHQQQPQSGASEQASLDSEWPSLAGGQQQQQHQAAANSRLSRPTRATAAAAAAAVAASSSPARPSRLQAAVLPQAPLRLVTPLGHFVDEARDYLELGNTNFAVVGVLGLQASGKSSLLNALLGNQLPGDQPADTGREFDVETLENVVENSHRTRGVQLQVTPERLLLLDSEALLALPSAETLIQAAASERRSGGGAGGGAASAGASSAGQADFITVETGATMHGIQLGAFLMSVCHLLLVVQDGWPDPDLLRLLLTADMLRPAVLDGTDFQPRVVFVLNRAPPATPPPDQLRHLLAGVFESAAFRLDADDVFCLPLLDGSEDAAVEFEEELARLHKLILTAPRYHMLRQDLFNEKVWLEFAAQVWQDVQNSVMLSEYHRLIG